MLDHITIMFILASYIHWLTSLVNAQRHSCLEHLHHFKTIHVNLNLLILSVGNQLAINVHKCSLTFLCKSPLTRLKSHCSVRGYKLLLQQKLIDPPLECCEIVICWKAFIGEGVPNGCGSRKKA